MLCHSMWRVCGDVYQSEFALHDLIDGHVIESSTTQCNQCRALICQLVHHSSIHVVVDKDADDLMALS